MERHLKRVAWGVAAMVAMGAPSYAADVDGVMKGLKDVEVKGYVEASYNYNFNDPADQANRFRVFDGLANTFNFNMAELVLTKSTETGPGFGLVLNYGADTRLTSASPYSGIADDFDVQQAYVANRFMGGALEAKLGKYATLAGAEVIEGPSNYNISRSLLFGYAIPFTHTGLRVAYPAEMLSLTLGVNNGWDSALDTDKGKTAEAQVGVNLSMLALGVTGYYGTEGGDTRTLIDVLATIKPTDTIALVLNYDNGTQADGVAPGTDAGWSGYAAYLNLGLGDKHAVTVRGEVFDDEDGFRTGVAQTLKEVTLTFACKMMDSLEWRAEYRYDMSDVDAFVDSDGTAQDTQSTVALAAYYTF